MNGVVEKHNRVEKDKAVEVLMTPCSRCSQAIWTIEEEKERGVWGEKPVLAGFCDKLKKDIWNEVDGKPLPRRIADCSALIPIQAAAVFPRDEPDSEPRIPDIGLLEQQA